MRRHELLRRLHQLVQPRTYLEIGVNTGRSLSLSRCRSIGIDPFYRVDRELRCDLHLVRATSDEFFLREHPLAHFAEPVIDLAFIDGMHLSEYALRDFINVERFSRAATVIVLDDMLPRTADEAARDRFAANRANNLWAGDVYKVATAIRDLRPDVVCLDVDTTPTGTAVLLLPDPTKGALAEAYDDLVASFVVPDPQEVPDRVLRRTGAVSPQALVDAPFWRELRRARELPDSEGREVLRAAVAGAGILASEGELAP